MDPAEVKKAAKKIGYPIIIKAVYGGGGKGIAVVHNADDFAQTFQRVSAEARSAFGNGDVYLERFIESLRHVEVQILRDSRGNTKVLGLRDCSVQRNNQKLIEETPSPLIEGKHRKLRDKIGKAAVRAMSAPSLIVPPRSAGKRHPTLHQAAGADIVHLQHNRRTGAKERCAASRQRDPARQSLTKSLTCLVFSAPDGDVRGSVRR
jgi:hypothetical protein